MKKIIQKVYNQLNNQLVKNILLVGGITFGVKILGFFKELIIAYFIGLSELIDTYLLAFLIPGFISTIFLGPYKSVFIPNFLIAKEQGEDISFFLGKTLSISFYTSLVLVLVTFLVSDVFVEFLYQGHTSEYYQLIKNQLYFLLPCITIWAITSVLNGLLNIYKEFFWSSLSGIFTPIATIFFLLFFRNTFGELVLAIGTFIGSFINLIYLVILCYRKDILKLRFRSGRTSSISEMIKQIPVKIASALINGLNEPVDKYFSAQLTIGSVSALNYANKLPAFAIGIFAIAIGNVVLPHFSSLAVKSHSLALKGMKKMSSIVFIAGLMIALAMFISSEFLISLLFERNEFKPEDTQFVFPIQQMFVLQIPFYAVGIIFNRFLTSINKNNFLVISSIISLALNIALNTVFIDLMGVSGLALATSIVSLTNTVVIFIYISRLKSSLNV
ncbi:murein biosynthesis integral membrane protein MurJ [Flagellimonas lutimaris]|uniref:murein biosynthesis integral membrane protein MurJ n=1 Tax=Flagellimonas lutimaris TaxID=475082 RepID=UPI003F5CE6C6